MNHLELRYLRFCGLVGVLGLSGLVIESEANARVCGSLAGVVGRVEVLRLKVGAQEDKSDRVRNYLPGRNSFSLECDDVVITRSDSTAKVVLAQGKIAMAPDSRLELSSFVSAEAASQVDMLNLTYGKLRTLIKKKDTPAASGAEPQAHFRIRTSSAVVGVRGTDFFTSYNPNENLTEQATIEGRVEVENRVTQEKVEVKAGEQVLAQAPIVSPVGVAETAEVPKPIPMKVTPIKESVKNEMRQASAVVADDKEFVTEQAVKVLGQPKNWVIQKEKVPEKFKDLKNEF